RRVSMRSRPRLAPLISVLAATALSVVCAYPTHAQWVPDGNPICTAPFEQNGIALTPDGAGGGDIAWHDWRALTPANQYAAAIYVVRLTAAGGVAPGWPGGGLLVCNAPGNQWWPQLVPDGAGGAIVTWQDDRVSPDRATDVYAEHVLASGIVDPAWTANGVRLSGAPQMQYLAGAISDGAGGAIVVLEDYRDNWDPVRPGTDIYAQRVTAGGAIAPGWPTDGAPVCIAPSDQSYPHVASDGAG